MSDADLLPNPSPGEVLLEDFLKPMGMSQNELARALRVPPRRINEIVLGKRSISADTDLRLARYFGVSEGLFLGLQASAARSRRCSTPSSRARREELGSAKDKWTRRRHRYSAAATAVGV
jgi:addiction module HigA family antidote